MSDETDPLIIDLKELGDYLDETYSSDGRTVAAAIAELQRLRDERDALLRVKEAASHFVWKCENGLARSKESYAQFKKAIQQHEELL